MTTRITSGSTPFGRDAARLDFSELRFDAAPRQLADQGLLGWLSVVVNDCLKLTGIALRRTLDDRLTLSFPAKTTADGKRLPYFHPISDEARRAIEDEVFAALRGSTGVDR